MQLARGKVVGGKVIVEGTPLPEGATVAILAPEAEETFHLGAEEENALLEAIGQADRGELVDGFELIGQLRRLD